MVSAILVGMAPAIGDVMDDVKAHNRAIKLASKRASKPLKYPVSEVYAFAADRLRCGGLFHMEAAICDRQYYNQMGFVK
jgi:hypothetical protein